MERELSRDEKMQLNRDRQNAVRHAWKREESLIREGLGTRDWTMEQQKELLETGHVKGYEGQHMKAVSAYPEYASDVNNIQFLSSEDHLMVHNMVGGHGYQSPTNGYYNEVTGEYFEFGNEPPHIDARELGHPYCQTEEYSRIYGSVEQNQTLSSSYTYDLSDNVDNSSDVENSVSSICGHDTEQDQGVAL